MKQCEFISMLKLPVICLNAIQIDDFMITYLCLLKNKHLKY